MAKREEQERIVRGKGKAVTVVVSRRVFPGKEKEYDDWVRRLIELAKETPGSTNVTMLAPEPGKQGLHHLVMRFADEVAMHTWETSYARQKLSHEADAFSQRIRQEATGLETWFAIPECPELQAPPHWKMAAVTFLAVYAMSLAIIRLIQWFIKDLNFYVESLLVAALLVGLLTWVVMPFLSQRVFRKWLYK
jgi:antibiotic biosynthesis monooxygenase (ABM) superfamily enzyme